MDNKRIVLNTLVFADRVEKGETQSKLMEDVWQLGFKNVEIRREYIHSFEVEVPEIAEAAKKFDLELFYSVPDEVFVNGKINQNLTGYLEEAKLFGVKHIKFNIGDFEHFKGDLSAELTPLLEQGIEVNIENDQTQTSGTITAIQTFMKAVTEKEINLGYVYDLGNWRFVGEDETQAANQLGSHVRYIHLKDVAIVDGANQAAGLDKGDINWRNILDILPKKVPVAIEYPTLSNQEIIEAQQKIISYE